jgi:hypothetical protein
MLPFVPVVTEAVICPAGWFNIDGVCMGGQACPAGTEFANGCCVYRGCPEGNVRVRGRCIPPPMNCNSDETYSEGRCEGPKCPSGLVLAKRRPARILDRPQRSTDCGPGEVFTNDQCQPAPGGGPKMCNTYCGCPPGTRVSEDGTCKQSSCGPHMVERDTECVCEPGYQGVVDGNGKLSCVPPTSNTCPGDMVPVNGQCCTPEALAAGTCGGTRRCPAGTVSIRGQCIFVDPACRGSDCPPVPRPCANGQPRNSDGSCPTTTTICPLGYQVNGTCCDLRAYNAGRCGGGPPTTTTTTGCPGNAQRIDGKCSGSNTGGCKSGQFRGDDGTCQNKPTTSRCGKNESWNGETCAKNKSTKDAKNKKEGKKERQRSDSDNPKSSHTNRTKQFNPSQLQRGSTQQFQRGPSGPINSSRGRR